MTGNIKKINASEEMVLMLKNMWLRHSAGLKQSSDNVYCIELPAPTAAEIADSCDKMLVHYDEDELYGAWV